MEGAFGTRLAETGNQLTVFDLHIDKVATLVAKGVKDANTAAEAAAVSDHVITSLNAPKSVDVAVIGKTGVAGASRPGTLTIEMSFFDPDTTKDLSAKALDGWIAHFQAARLKLF